MRCEICSAQVTELRRGRCWGCYSRWSDARAVGLGAVCVFCEERRRDHLRSVELLGCWTPVCYTCNGRISRLDPMPQTFVDLRTTLRRDRRAEARRKKREDTRVFPYERRDGERRDQPVASILSQLLPAEDLRSLQDREVRAMTGDLTTIRSIESILPKRERSLPK